MKRGLLLIILLFFLTVANAQKDDLRLTIDSKFLEKQGIIINLTDFLDVKPEYYLANRPKYVSIILDNEFKLAKIQPIEGKSGRETVVITTNKSTKKPPIPTSNNIKTVKLISLFNVIIE